jgi:hypothetical protein
MIMINIQWVELPLAIFGALMLIALFAAVLDR